MTKLSLESVDADTEANEDDAYELEAGMEGNGVLMSNTKEAITSKLGDPNPLRHSSYSNR